MTLARRLIQIGTDFLDGLNEACAAVRGRLSPPPRARARVENAALVLAIAGKPVGAIRFDGGAEPPDLPRRLAGHTIEVEIPPDWAVQKSLPPTTREALAFLPAFVTYQIDRLTPWRAVDVAYHIETRPIPGEKNRLSVDVFVVPTVRIARALATLAGQPGTRVLLEAPHGAERRTIALDPAGDLQPKVLWRRRTACGLAAAALLALLLTGELLWELDGLGRGIAELDDQVAARQAMLRRLQSGATAGAEDASPLARLPLRVRTLENLSQTLPDGAYLTALTMRRDRLQVTGLATRAADLVPTLEESKHFAEVAFTGAITRADEGRGDRFQLDMRIADGGSPP